MNNGLFFIIGTYRSGTTLLRNVLNIHPEIAITPELRFFDTILAKRRKFGSLEKKNIRFKLVDYIIARTKKNIEKGIDNWGELDININNLKKDLRKSENEKDIFLAYSKACASKENYSVLIEKTPINIFFIDKILKLFPEAKFIHIKRDGREVCASACKRWKVDFYKPAARWNISLNAYASFKKKYRDNIFFEVKYEDIAGERSEDVLKNIFKFLGSGFECYDFSKLSNLNNTSSFKIKKKGLFVSKNFNDYFNIKSRKYIEALLRNNLLKYEYETKSGEASIFVYFKYTIEYLKERLNIYFRRIGFYHLIKK